MDNNDNKLIEIVTEAAFVKCKLIVILERHRIGEDKLYLGQTSSIIRVA